jgi:hypothetical protein
MGDKEPGAKKENPDSERFGEDEREGCANIP